MERRQLRTRKRNYRYRHLKGNHRYRYLKRPGERRLSLCAIIELVCIENRENLDFPLPNTLNERVRIEEIIQVLNSENLDFSLDTSTLIVRMKIASTMSHF